MKRLGVLGGSFDPIHVGHLVLAEGIREALGLERVLFVPAAVPPHKPGSVSASAQDRLEMVRLAVKGNPFFEASDMEIRRSGVSYTIDTVRELKRAYDGEIYLLIGGDTVGELKTWKDVGELLELCRVAVGARPGFKPPDMGELRAELGPGAAEVLRNVVDIPQVDVSSTEIRRRLGQGKSVRYLLPDGVLGYVNRKRLYRETAT